MAPRKERPLNSFFSPRSVAVAGVSPDDDKLGSIIFENLLRNRKAGVLKADVFPLNPKHAMLRGTKCYPGLNALPVTPELLVVATPAEPALELVREASKAGVKAVVLIPGGFSEVGETGLQSSLLKAAGEMRVLGPNTIGLLDTTTGVETLFIRPTKSLPGGREMVSHFTPKSGGVVVVTQSGHLGEVVSEELTSKGIGIRALVGTGNQLDVTVPEVIRHFSNDSRTKVIAAYLEGIPDGRAFMEAVATASRTKPVVVLKVGRTDVGARAALTHTASIVGDYETYRAALRQSGGLEARTFQELVDSCVMFSTAAPARGRRLAIVTNAGGVGALVADAAETEGMLVAAPTDISLVALKSEFEGRGFIANASLSNPFDITATASTEDFVRFTEAVVQLDDYDAAIILPTHQTPAIGYDIASRLIPASKGGKPVVMCVIGNSEFADSMRAEFGRENVPSFPTPERAADALSMFVGRSTRRPVATLSRPAPRLRLKGLGHFQGPLPSETVHRLLRAFGIPTPDSTIVRSELEVRAGKVPKFPVACKLLSAGLVHKSDIRGVILDVKDPASLESAYRELKELSRRAHLRFEGVLVQGMKSGVEVLLGATRDPVFGPTVVFGAGGRHAEAMKDYAVSVAPIGVAEARAMIKRTKVASILEDPRGGRPADLAKLAAVVSEFSRILPSNPSISEVEINPLMVDGGIISAVDARAVNSDKSRRGATH